MPFEVSCGLQKVLCHKSIYVIPTLCEAPSACDPKLVLCSLGRVGTGVPSDSGSRLLFSFRSFTSLSNNDYFTQVLKPSSSPIPPTYPPLPLFFSLFLSTLPSPVRSMIHACDGSCAALSPSSSFKWVPANQPCNNFGVFTLSLQPCLQLSEEDSRKRGKR